MENLKIGAYSHHNQSIGRYIKPQHKHYGMKHYFTSTIYHIMVETLLTLSMGITDTRNSLWNKAQVVVATIRTELGTDNFYVGEKKIHIYIYSLINF